MDKEVALKLMWKIRENISNDACYLDYREAMREGILALEKQIAKKPIYSELEDVNDDGQMIPTKAVCPACGEEFEFGTWNAEDNHHCTCGQAIDWELKLRIRG